MSLPHIPGVKWVMSPVARGTGSDKMDLGKVPIPVVDDVQQFVEKFPQLALAAINGTSMRVSAQQIGREIRWKNRSATAEYIAEHVHSWMRGVRASRGPVEVYVCYICEAKFGASEECRIHIATDHS